MDLTSVLMLVHDVRVDMYKVYESSGTSSYCYLNYKIFQRMCLNRPRTQRVRRINNGYRREWLDHLPPVSAPTKIPPEATRIESPLIKVAWDHHLRSYPYQGLVHRVSSPASE